MVPSVPSDSMVVPVFSSLFFEVSVPMTRFELPTSTLAEAEFPVPQS